MNAGIFGYTCLGISVTLRCPLECAHCITNSSPRVTEEMSTEEALGYVRAAAGVVDHISITGGEPLLDRARLRAVIAEGKRLGYIVSVMTSGYWGRTPEGAHATLAELQALGLDMLGISLDEFHLAYVEEDRCRHICEAADVLGVPVAVRCIRRRGSDYGDHVRALLAHTKAEVNVNDLVKLGRAEDLDDKDFQRCAHAPRDRCETVTAADVVPGGIVYACCGPGLYMREHNPLVLGNALEEPLSDILERGLSNPFMKVINTRGPVGLLEDLQAAGRGDLVRQRSRYTDACQLCLDICNSPPAVEALEELYSDPDTRRTQNALQFLKMVGEQQELDRVRAT